jgi:hypothetical protein
MHGQRGFNMKTFQLIDENVIIIPSIEIQIILESNEIPARLADDAAAVEAAR